LKTDHATRLPHRDQGAISGQLPGNAAAVDVDHQVVDPVGRSAWKLHANLNVAPCCEDVWRRVRRIRAPSPGLFAQGVAGSASQSLELVEDVLVRNLRRKEGLVSGATLGPGQEVVARWAALAKGLQV
jgi:hypothetical protein